MLGIMFSAGLVMGLLSKMASALMIKKRQGSVDNSRMFNGLYINLIWALLCAAGYLAIGLLFYDNVFNMVECAIVFSICLMISVVDFQIRKIPNELLLALLILKIVILFITHANPFNSIVGMLFAGVVFLFPAKFGKTIGMGDIKLAMVTGFYLSTIGFIQTTAIMGICLLFYWLYLVLTRKGGLKTSAALGPYISLGFIITLCVSLTI